MSSKFLQVFVSNARFDNAELLKAMAAEPTLTQVLTFCENYRIQGIGRFLLYGDADALQLSLYKSGRAYLSFLDRLREAQLVTSRAGPFFDALAALDLDGAQGVAIRSRRTWHPGMEYKEDFLYVHFLMSHFFLGAEKPQLLPLLEEYEQVLQGSDDARLEICRAFLEGNAEGFAAGLECHLAAEKQRHDRLLKREAISEEWWATIGQVSIEGLALLTLATHAGLRVSREYQCVPSLARARGTPRHPADAWRNVGE
jgi:hypothetical protein